MGTQKNRLNEAVLLSTQKYIYAKTDGKENIYNFTLNNLYANLKNDLTYLLQVPESNGLAYSLVRTQSELPRAIPRNSLESDHGCTSRIYFDNAGVNVTLM